MSALRPYDLWQTSKAWPVSHMLLKKDNTTIASCGCPSSPARSNDNNACDRRRTRG